MLLDNLFYISSQGVPDDGEKGGEIATCYAVCLNANHSIYEAHFPGNPITPGACIVQMCVEILSHYTGKELSLASLVNAKFLRPICPVTEKKYSIYITSKLEDVEYSANFTIRDADEVCARMKLICRKN